MKKNIIKIAFIAMAAITMPSAMNAQSKVGVSDLLNKAKTVVKDAQTQGTATNQAVNTAKDVLGDLLGTKPVTEASIVGTWKYTQPCVAFDGENTLSNIGGKVASSGIETKLANALSKAGITPGKMTIVFKSDKTFSATVGKKTTTGTYALNGNNITLTFKNSKKPITANVKNSAGVLQIAMNTDKLLSIVQNVSANASGYSQQMAAVSALLNKYKGMYLGLKFQK